MIAENKGTRTSARGLARVIELADAGELRYVPRTFLARGRGHPRAAGASVAGGPPSDRQVGA
jgi:hypothetical protein